MDIDVLLGKVFEVSMKEYFAFFEIKNYDVVCNNVKLDSIP